MKVALYSPIKEYTLLENNNIQPPYNLRYIPSLALGSLGSFRVLEA